MSPFGTETLNSVVLIDWFTLGCGMILTFASCWLWDGSKAESFPWRGLHFNRRVWVDEKSCKSEEKNTETQVYARK